MTVTRKAVLLGVALLLGTTAWAQEFPRNEVALTYSLAYYVPSTSIVKASNQFLNGGGGAYVFNFNSFLGFRADLQGYGSFTTVFTVPVVNPNPQGLTGTFKASGNLFTYLFGPQIKIHTHGLQPFGALLVGGAHSNLYGTAFHDCGVTFVCTSGQAPSGNAFAFDIGGGVDIPLGHHFEVRPVEFDYLMTDFQNRFTGGVQNNWRYLAGVNLTLGSGGSK
jgi:hypothetical protein